MTEVSPKHIGMCLRNLETHIGSLSPSDKIAFTHLNAMILLICNRTGFFFSKIE